MKQEEFFKLLDRRLSVIEDAERQDILDEYRQHIAMKLKEEDVSEEEALADFGDVDDFADEILSAYHVRTGASEEQKAKKDPVLLPKVKAAAGAVWSGIRGFFGRCGRAVSRFFGACRTKLCRLLHRTPGEKRPKPIPREAPLWKTCLRWLAAGVRTVVRWCCNVVCGGISLLGAAFAALFLVLCGACTVVAVQGYPLVGSAIVLLGLLLCAVAVTAFFWGLIRKKQKGAANHGK